MCFVFKVETSVKQEITLYVTNILTCHMFSGLSCLYYLCLYYLVEIGLNQLSTRAGGGENTSFQCP